MTMKLDCEFGKDLIKGQLFFDPRQKRIFLVENQVDVNSIGYAIEAYPTSADHEICYIDPDSIYIVDKGLLS